MLKLERRKKMEQQTNVPNKFFFLVVCYLGRVNNFFFQEREREIVTYTQYFFYSYDHMDIN